MFEDVVKADFVHALGWEMQLGDVRKDIGTNARLAGMFRRRIIDVHVTIEVLFAAAEVEFQRTVRGGESKRLQFFQSITRGSERGT